MKESQTLVKSGTEKTELTIQNRIAIIEDNMRKTYLSRLSEMRIAKPKDWMPLEEDLIENVRVFHVTEMVYQKEESSLEKFTTVFNTLSTYNSSVFIIMDSNGKKTDFYLGVRNNESEERLKRSTVTLGDTLKNTLSGHFPGIKLHSEDRNSIKELSEKIRKLENVASVSIIGNKKPDDKQSDGFVQGLEKLVLAMHGRPFTGVIIAENQTKETIEIYRKTCQNVYTKLSPLQKVQISEGTSSSTSKNKSFFEMDSKQKAATIGSSIVALTGVVLGRAVGDGVGAMVGGQIGSQLGGLISSLAPNENETSGYNKSTSTTTENKEITDLMNRIDEYLKRCDDFENYGMWNVSGYFASDDMSAAEIAASNYRSLMNGDESGREVSAINSWRKKSRETIGEYKNLTVYLSRFEHPKFVYGSDDDKQILIDATTSVSGKEIGIHMGLPRASVAGLPVIEHAEFGKEVISYKVFGSNREMRPEDRMTLGRVFDLGHITNKLVELDNKSLNMHTFITGSTGSGKSNTVYQILTELHQDKIPFLVIEPAKGEYKDVFGNWSDVNVFSTNPNISQLLNINPFRFPKSIHVLEHIDGLVEIFSMCWPMYDAMPSFFKEAILKSYESVGWDLGSSTFSGKNVEYPDFEILVDELNTLIENSDYASDIKSNYRGALITRVKTLTVGLNKFIFTSEQTPYSVLFDENCIVDISRVKSTETKSLIMGLLVYILNEYRIDRKSESNSKLKHITVIEEAHNLLKNTTGRDSELVGKSVELLTQTIAEIRTYGEGFVIVDQSPSSVDISAIKNTNTKIVLRTPEENDRNAIGHSMGLNSNQVNEIAKLPSGVAVVYQNDWVNPVLTVINKADVNESAYIPDKITKIRTIKSARTVIIKMLLRPWLGGDKYSESVLRDSLKVLEITREDRKLLSKVIDDYVFFNGQLIWKKSDLQMLGKLARSVVGLTEKKLLTLSNAEELQDYIMVNIEKVKKEDINKICAVITYKEGEKQ